MSLKDFVNLQKIGEGSYSSVHKVKRLSDNQEYALKKVKLSGLSEKEKDNALNEIRILASISHPNMIAYKDAFFDETSHSLCIIMELAINGDLSKKIETAKKRCSFIAEEEIWTVALHMLRGLKAMHSKKILHRDLKCANVFISQTNEYKIGDLNVSKVAKKGLVYTQTGTPYYASPEVWRDEPYNGSSDIWSFGCILYELAALNPPFRAKDMEGLYKKVQKGIFERIPQRYSQDLQKFISLCLQVNSVSRPSVVQLLNNVLLKRNTEFLAETHEEQIDKENTLNPEDLLNTIKMPKNPKQLKEKLPKPQYNRDMLNSSYDEGQNYRERNHTRNMSVKINRIQSVASHKSQDYIHNDDEDHDTVLPLIQQRVSNPSVLSGLDINSINPSSVSSNVIPKYENPSSIVNDSRNYLAEVDSQNKKRYLPNSSRSSNSYNYNQDYGIKNYHQKQMIQPTISIVSKKDTGFNQHPLSAGVSPLRNRINSSNQLQQPGKNNNNSSINNSNNNINNANIKNNYHQNINSYARIANLYQKSQAQVNYMPTNQSAVSVDQSGARPTWWG